MKVGDGETPYSSLFYLSRPYFKSVVDVKFLDSPQYPVITVLYQDFPNGIEFEPSRVGPYYRFYYSIPTPFVTITYQTLGGVVYDNMADEPLLVSAMAAPGECDVMIHKVKSDGTLELYSDGTSSSWIFELHCYLYPDGSIDGGGIGTD